MKIYNTLSKSKEEFLPLEEGKVKMYVCGPTVYNFIHIGNARPMIVFDTVRRYLEYKGFEVNYVSNFTDVDDKIIKKALEEGVDSSVISKRYIEECKKDMEGLNVKPATKNPLATEEIDGMLEMIQTLMDTGHAYKAVDGTVYFKTRSFPGYGKLSHKKLDDLQAGHREIKVVGEETKEDDLDFVLWKPKKEGEPYWDSKWCKGRPGWHIECSVMAKIYLGDTIDIHAGGEDLIFPHHENEIAQSEAANGKQFSKYWLHNGFINVDNEKMSKSKGNFFTLREIAKEIPYEVIRFFILNGHYRSPINFSRELMEAAGNGLDRIKNCVKDIKFITLNGKDSKLSENEQKLISECVKFKNRFEESMDDDFNTADAVSAIFEFVKFANVNIGTESTREFADIILSKIIELCDILGIEPLKEEAVADTGEIEKLIEKRQLAKKEKNWAEADRIRDELSEMGILIEDTRAGVRWSRK